MSRFPIPQTPPADLYGRRDRDRVIRVLETIANGRLRWAAAVHRHCTALAVRDGRIPLVVTDRRVEARDENVISVVLADPVGGTLPPWRPGAHLDLELPSGKMRQYSLCGDPADRRRFRIAVRRIPDGGGGSVEVHDTLTAGIRLTVRGPRNAFAFAVPGYGSPAHRLRFVAGGIGITPILPMIRHADRLGLDWSMVYTGRSRESLPFLDELAGFGNRVRVRTDDVDGLPSAAELLGPLTAATAVYCCGPVPMTTMLRTAVSAVPGVEFHSERFSAAPVLNGRPFRIELARTGETLTVPADRTALEMVRTLRPDVAYSCRQGFCRTCVVRVLAGAPEHRDTSLTPDEHDAGDMLICVSRAAEGERLVLDL